MSGTAQAPTDPVLTCPTHPANVDEHCRVCHAGPAMKEVEQALAREWGVLEADVQREIKQRSAANTLRETPLVSQWLTLFSALADDDSV